MGKKKSELCDQKKARILILMRRFWDLRLKVLFYNSTISLGILKKKEDTTQYSFSVALILFHIVLVFPREREINE